MPISPISEGIFTAHPTRVLATNGRRPHDPRAWADAVAAGMIGISDTMPRERRAAAQNVRNQIMLVLFAAFRSLRAGTSHDDIVQITDTTLTDIERVLSRSHWAFDASAPQIRAEFTRYITLNLTDAATLIRRME